MKNAISMLLLISFLISCNAPEGKQSDKVAEPASALNHDHVEKGAAPDLVLNDGAKWKADSTTVLNVVMLENIASGTGTNTIEEYHQTAERLQDGLNKMIKECKMTGPDHEALHHWLEPLLQETKNLKDARGTENAAAILNEIQERLNMFPKYFEQS